MKTKTSNSKRGTALWQRVVQLEGKLSPTAARAILKLQFSEPDHAVMNELAAKARAGKLSAEEQSDLDTFERLGCLLDIVHSYARHALNKKAIELLQRSELAARRAKFPIDKTEEIIRRARRGRKRP